MASIRLKRFDLSFRTAYAQAKELALAQREVPLLTPGAVQTERRRGSKFVYRYRYDATGKRVAEYIGPEGDKDTAGKVAAITEEIRQEFRRVRDLIHSKFKEVAQIGVF